MYHAIQIYQKLLVENKQVPKDVDAPRFAPNAQLDYTLPLCMEVQLQSTTLELRNVVSEVSKNLLLYYGMKSYSSRRPNSAMNIYTSQQVWKVNTACTFTSFMTVQPALSRIMQSKVVTNEVCMTVWLQLLYLLLDATCLPLTQMLSKLYRYHHSWYTFINC